MTSEFFVISGVQKCDSPCDDFLGLFGGSISGFRRGIFVLFRGCSPFGDPQNTPQNPLRDPPETPNFPPRNTEIPPPQKYYFLAHQVPRNPPKRARTGCRYFRTRLGTDFGVTTSHPPPHHRDFPELWLKPSQEQKNFIRPLNWTPGSPLRQEYGADSEARIGK